jgi:hypothetical protein
VNEARGGVKLMDGVGAVVSNEVGDSDSDRGANPESQSNDLANTIGAMGA